MARLLLENVSTVVSPVPNATTRTGNPCASGKGMGELSVLRDQSIVVDGNKITYLGPADELGTVESVDTAVDCRGKTALPGFVDSHTHCVFAGNRSGEFAMRLRGASYQEIYEAGGGIRSSMKSVRSASRQEIIERSKPFCDSAFKHGTTTLEVKSGYGLDVESELKLLRAIHELDDIVEPELVPTFLGAHALPPEYADNRSGYVDLVVNEMIPAVAQEKLAEYCDVFTDEGYFTIEESERIFQAAADCGMKARIHVDEMADVGGAAFAASINAVSADHLLKVSDDGIVAMREAGVIATLLPGTAFYLNLPYAPARKLVDQDVIVAVATDCNPGSNLCENMGMTLAFSCMGMRMSIEEAITAATLNGAAALDRSDMVGRIEPGVRADIALFNVPDYPDIVYHYGVNLVDGVIKNGHYVAVPK